MAKKKQFAKEVFIKIEGEGDDQFLSAADDINNLAEHEIDEIAVYELKRVLKARLVTQILPD